MRIPLSRWGMREMLLVTVFLGLPAAVCCAWGATGWSWYWLPAVVLGLLWGWGILFFRDPERPTPVEPGVFVAPADGRVTETADVDHDVWAGGPATRLSIFLSIFDVHINRSPCAGVVRRVEYQPGRFLDARDPRSGSQNEANTIVIEPDESGISTVVVRQIAGKIARRIVCTVRPGDRLERGERIGMIKFGSRTELIIAGQNTCEPAVRVGDKARGGLTVMARRRRDPADVSSLAPAAVRAEVSR